MKIYLTCILLFISTGIAIASETSEGQLGKGKTNVMYSPFAYNHFFGSISGMNKDYALKEQFSDVPIKRIGIENFIINTRSKLGDYLGLFLFMSHNRVNTGTLPDGGMDFKKKDTSITTLSFGFFGMQPIGFISRQLYLKVAFGISSVDLWRSEVSNNNKYGRCGIYIAGGFRYVFSSDSKYNINVGIDFSHSESFFKSSDNGYDVIGLRGIYPYVGIMW